MTLVGTGALATLLAARLGAIVPVSVLGSWAEALAAFRERGATIETPEGSSCAPVDATSDPADCRGARLALVLVKAGATARAAAMIRSFLAPDGVAVTLQNGLGNSETLAAALGPERVVTGTAEVGATLVSPGRARSGGGRRIRLAAHPKVAEVEALLSRAGFDVSIVPDAASLVWEKLSVTAPLLPLTALLGVTNGEILRRPSAAEPSSTRRRGRSSRRRPRPGSSFRPAIPGRRRGAWPGRRPGTSRRCCRTSGAGRRPRSTRSTVRSSRRPGGSAFPCR